MMAEPSGGRLRTVLFRLLPGIAAWALFAVAAHELIHRILPPPGPIPGPGLRDLGLQVLPVTIGALGLLALRRQRHDITLRVLLATVIWVALILFGHHLTHLDVAETRQTLTALREAMGMGALLAGAAVLAVLLGLPFVPSVEMGLLMMAVFGRDGAIAAWLATITGLSLAYAAGRYMPVDFLQSWLARHGLPTASPGSGSVLDTWLDPQDGGRAKGATRRLARFLLGHRYLLFAVLINMPGNSLLGGGGGIALVSGFARLYRWPWFVLTVALASLPIPLLVFFGLVRVEDWLAALGNG